MWVERGLASQAVTCRRFAATELTFCTLQTVRALILDLLVEVEFLEHLRLKAAASMMKNPFRNSLIFSYCS